MTIGEAARAGLAYLRKAYWAFPDDVLVLDLVGGGYHGPWATLLSPACREIPGLTELAEQRVMILGDLTDDWVEAPPPADGWQQQSGRRVDEER